MGLVAKTIKKLPIRRKLVLAIVSVSVVVLMFASAIMTFQAAQDKKKSIISSLNLTARIIGDNSVVPLVQGDTDTVAESLLALFSDETIRMGCIYDRSFELFAEYAMYWSGEQGCPKEFDMRLVPEEQRTNVSEQEFVESMEDAIHGFYPDRLIVMHAIESEGDIIGLIYLVSDLSLVNKFIVRQTYSTIVIILCTVILIILLTAWLQKIIADPVIHLTNTVKEISETQNYSVRAKKETDDEFGILAESFNSMLDIIQSREKELTESEAQALTAKESAEKANAAKSEFLANMSHELRTPMNSILGLAKILVAEKGLDEEYRDMLNVIYMSSSSMLEIVNDILDLSKFEADGITLEHRAFDFEKMSGNIVKTLAPLASQKGLDLNLTYKTDKWPYLIGDSARLGRILTNVIGNATKYTKQGSVQVTFDSKPLSNGDVELICKVQDTGIGIPADKLDYIFEKFTQADESINRKFGGTGLGLAITKELIELMGGKISVTSEIGKGSCFTLVVPFKTAEKPEEDNLGLPHEGYTHSYEKDRILIKEARVLVAEDHELNQIFIQKILKRLGAVHYKVVPNGQLAVDEIKNNQYDLILMDCHMPEKNGYEATEEIREMEQKEGKKEIPVVALTADVMTGTREKCEAIGMNEYISKPVNEEILAQVLSRWLIIPGQTRGEGKKEKAERDATPPIDLAMLKEYADGDPETEKEFVKVFLSQSEQSIEILKNHCVDGECSEWMEAAHKFKSGAAMVGAEYLRSLCEQAQAMLNAKASEREEVFEKIQSSYVEVETYLKEQA